MIVYKALCALAGAVCCYVAHAFGLPWLAGAVLVGTVAVVLRDCR